MSANAEFISFQLSVISHGEELASRLFGTPLPEKGLSRAIPGGATLTFIDRKSRLSFGVPDTLEFLLTFGSGIAIGFASDMVANWLSERLKPHASKIRVPEGVIEINEADLRAAIERAVIRAINQTIYTPQDYKHPEPSEPDAHGDKGTSK